MKLLSHPLFAAAIALTLSLSAVGDEVWTFRFTPTGSRPYTRDGCGLGDCGSPSQIHADISGTFSILLNRQTGAGKPLAVSGTLSNFMTTIWSGGSTTVSYETPHRTALPADVSLQHSPGHFHYQGDGLWRLVPDGFNFNLPFLEPYDIWFTLNSATLNVAIPGDNFDSGARIENAYATLISVTTAGDFNADNRIDARDYISWRKSGGSATNYNLWRNFFGTTTTASASGTEPGTIPEPAAAVLLATAAVILSPHRRRR